MNKRNTSEDDLQYSNIILMIKSQIQTTISSQVEVYKHLIIISLQLNSVCSVYYVFSSIYPRGLLVLVITEAPGTRIDMTGHSSPFFSNITFIILRNGELWLGESIVVCQSFIFFILVMLMDFSDTNICLHIIMKLFLRFQILKF